MLLKEPVLHYARDRRCYQGAMCSDLAREVKSRDDIFDVIKEKYPDYFCTYFPMEGKYMSFDKYSEVSGNFFEDKGECLLEAWRLLIQDKEAP